MHHKSLSNIPQRDAIELRLDGRSDGVHVHASLHGNHAVDLAEVVFQRRHPVGGRGGQTMHPVTGFTRETDSLIDSRVIPLVLDSVTALPCGCVARNKQTYFLPSLSASVNEERQPHPILFYVIKHRLDFQPFPIQIRQALMYGHAYTFSTQVLMTLSNGWFHTCRRSALVDRTPSNTRV